MPVNKGYSSYFLSLEYFSTLSLNHSSLASLLCNQTCKAFCTKFLSELTKFTILPFYELFCQSKLAQLNCSFEALPLWNNASKHLPLREHMLKYQTALTHIIHSSSLKIEAESYYLFHLGSWDLPKSVQEPWELHQQLSQNCTYSIVFYGPP